MSDLAEIIGGTEESASNQNEEVLDTVADYFMTLATFVDTSDTPVNSSVSQIHESFQAQAANPSVKTIVGCC